MTKLDVTPSWKDVKPVGYYVYKHYRKTDMSLAYIGKGQLRRGFDKSPRSDWWISIARKHGIHVEIVCQGMTEAAAHALEVFLISIARCAGERICNMSDGGEGSSGCVSTNRKTVYCSNGMVFDSTISAADWVSEDQGINTTFSAISAAALGTHYTAYGLAWSYDEVPDEPKSPAQRRREHFSKKVWCSNGMIFPSLTAATLWLRDNGKPKASSSKLSRAARSDYRTAYGYTWEYL